MGRPKISTKIPDDLKQQICEYYLQPNSIESTTKKFNISNTALKQILQDANISTHTKEIRAKFCSNTRSKLFSSDQIQQIIELYLAGNSIRTIATNYSAGDAKIKQILLEHNIYLRSTLEQAKLGKDKAKQTNLEKYGAENVFAAESIKEKIKQTNLEKYGRINVGQFGTVEHAKAMLAKYGTTNVASLPDIKAKIAKTCQETYGGIGFASNELNEKAKNTCENIYGDRNYLNIEQYKQTMLEKYGGCGTASEQILEKIKQTCLKKYGDENYRNSEKTKQTCLEKYSVEHPIQNELVKQKCRDTLIDRYGVPYFAQSDEAAKYRKYLFVYAGEHFDSFPELVFYLYHIKNDISIKRGGIKFEYIYADVTHFYFPDFEVNDKHYEIKGDQFLKEDGTWQNPFDHTQDELYEAKHQCAIKNNVEILYSKDYQKYIDWFYDNGYKKEDFLNKK